MDEVFGRRNYLITLFVLVRYADKTLTQDMDFHKQVEQIHVYACSSASKPNRIEEEIVHDKFCYRIQTAETPTKIIELGGKQVEVFAKSTWDVKKVSPSVDGLKEIWATGSILDGNSSGRFFRDYLTGRVDEDGLGALYKVENIGDDGLGYRYFTGPQRASATKGKYFQGVPKAKQNGGVDESPIGNYLDMAGAFGNCRLEGGVGFRAGKKPEILLQSILKMFSNAGDLVADSFLGSGSTAAVAHKMGRRYIGIEMGEQAVTHCVPRLKAVIDGEQSGISKPVGWKGGGGFRFYRLGSPIFDEQGHIHPSIRFDHLAAHIWFAETRTPIHHKRKRSPLLGKHGETAYYLLYNGILGDKRPDGGNVLTRKVLAELPAHDGPKVIYGESSRLSAATLKQLGVIFKQTPYDVKAR
jgi:adenine-specific DNA-methyltransferase